MKGWTGLFLGILGTFVFSWIGLALVPALQIGSLEPQSDEEGTDIYPVPRSGMAERGRQVYIANGCNYCHTQQVRPDWLASDISRDWGTRRSAPRDYIFDQPALIGRMRTGPDLANIGKRPAPDTAPGPPPGATESTTSGAAVPVAPPGAPAPGDTAAPAIAAASPAAAGGASPASAAPATAAASPAAAGGASPAPATAAARTPAAGASPAGATAATSPAGAASPAASPAATAATAAAQPPPPAPGAASPSPAAQAAAAATASPGPSVVPPSDTSSGPPALSAAAQAAAGAPDPAQPAQVTDVVGGEPLLYTAAWHHRHLYSPRSVVHDSVMPAFRFLYRKQRIGGEPAANALVLARGERPKPGWEVVPTYDAECLVAYLMSLDQSHPLNEVKGTAGPAASPAAGGAAAATSPAPAAQAPAPGQ